MIKIENVEICGWGPAIRGMRNPMNSWEKSDSGWDEHVPPLSLRDKVDWDEYAKKYEIVQYDDEGEFAIGPNDKDLMERLAKGGPVHAKYRRMIAVYVDILAPLYWWKEFDTYKVGTVANSCSTMHKIHAKEFTLEDFSTEHLIDDPLQAFSLCDPSGNFTGFDMSSKEIIQFLCNILNYYRKKYLETKDKKYWWQMIQLLPSSYNQKRTVMLNYEVLANIYKFRRNHKLDEWNEFCAWIEGLPYSELITEKECKV